MKSKQINIFTLKIKLLLSDYEYNMNNPIYLNKLSDLTKYFGLPELKDKHLFYKYYDASEDFEKQMTTTIKHNFYGISLIVEGKGDINFSYWDKAEQAPVVYFLSPMQTTNLRLDHNVLKKYLLLFTEEFIRENPILQNIIYEFPFLKLSDIEAFVLLPEQLQEICNVFKAIEKIYHGTMINREKIIAHYVMILLLKTTEYHHLDSLKETQLEQVNDNTLYAFLALLNSEILDAKKTKTKYSVKYFADKLSVHPNHLSYLIKSKTQKSAKELIDEKIIEVAKTLINNSTMSIKEISFFLAFKEASHFTNFFKKHTGISPINYRNKK